jgi:hypothetical protein
MNSSIVSAVVVTLLLSGHPAAAAVPVDGWPAGVGDALRKAGDNRTELEKVLLHYRNGKDAQKFEAAKFLIANMDGHGYTVAALFDEEKNEIPFNALDHKNFGEAQAALDALEEEHGELEFKRKRFDEDLQTITAAYLIENIDLAFEAWRSKPWARNLTFEAFLEHVLPYRGSNEPIDSWRRPCLERYAGLADELEDPRSLEEAARRIQRDVHGWVGFSTLYYLHPTDQSFSEMDARGLGRCEDISNMIGYALRANAIPSASDYTPYWADRDNNHAWEVILDANGEGRAGLSNRAAKVYRKTFAIQRENLGCIKAEDEEVPRWLSGKSYLDVTAQYMETTDVTVRLEKEAPGAAGGEQAGCRFGYICVFNAGEWQAIHWGGISEGEATFTDMGRNIAYLPAYCADKTIVPAGPPFIVTREGTIRELRPLDGEDLEIEIAVTAPETPDADTRRNKPRVVVKPGKTYELFVWKGGWTSLGRQTAGEDPVAFESVPAGGLYWMVAEGSRRLERIFTIDEGRQVWW